MSDDIRFEVMCPRCGLHPVHFQPRGAYVSFCMMQLAFLLPREFTAEALDQLQANALAEVQAGSRDANH